MPSVSDSSNPWFSAEDDFKEKYGFRNNQKKTAVCAPGAESLNETTTMFVAIRTVTQGMASE